MKAVILAAGFGQRLWPITETIPKPLLPIGHYRLIDYSLQLLVFHGIHDILMNVHHLGYIIRETLGDGSAYGAHITYSQEEEILGTGGGIKRMHPHLDSTFVVINSDIVVDIDLHPLIAEHKARGSLATMVLRQDAPVALKAIDMADNQRIVGILDNNSDKSRAWMFTGIHILEPRFLEYIPPDINTCIVRHAYKNALANGEPIFGVMHDGYWTDAGKPVDYYQVNADALAQRLKLRHIDPLGGYALSPKRDVAGVVRMGDDVDLGSQVQLISPILLDNHCRIGARSVLSHSVLGERVIIGRDARVTESIILDGARVESDTSVHRMLIGRKASLSLQ